MPACSTLNGHYLRYLICNGSAEVYNSLVSRFDGAVADGMGSLLFPFLFMGKSNSFFP